MGKPASEPDPDLAASPRKVREIMEREGPTCFEDEDPAEVLARLEGTNFTSLPVLDRQGRLVGTWSRPPGFNVG
jgi:CBS domain-containing protein